MRCAFTASLACSHEHESGGGLVPTFMSVSVFSKVELGFFNFNFLLFRIMCVRYLIAIWEKDSIS